VRLRCLLLGCLGQEASELPPLIKVTARSAIDTVYGTYVVTAFLVLGFTALGLVTLVPGLSIRVRRSIAHVAARSFFVVSGVHVRIVGKERLPDGPCVVVANHASYIDGVLLKAFLPARFSFVIKKEITKVPLAGLLLRRIGSEFVDRFNRNAGAMDARRLIKAADAGQAFAFFPEGTFNVAPGIGKFHSGAFLIAARAGLPVIPVAIRGTRHMLPGGRILPRYSRLRIDILPAVLPPPEGQGSASAQALRDEARARILATVDEPDLAERDGVAGLVPRRSL
jgi:1-acyl-sn-glycerol-3-phosphate acyltransferase